MTKLSVNVNKIALLRNSRGHDAPNVVEFARRFIELGVTGITIHPRQDERHITRQDARDLGDLIRPLNDIELNIEGYPSETFLQLIEEVRPDQTTLVPDAPDQLTSDHGFDFHTQAEFLDPILTRLKATGTRVSVFLDPDVEQVKLAAQSKTDRIELYTEEYASQFHRPQHTEVHQRFHDAAVEAQKLGLGVNAGHDLNLENLPAFLNIPGILEVSIGHALIVECLEYGMPFVARRYLDICRRSALTHSEQ
ncbi:pyridoxine 5'-phosphate synthase [Reinekea blandensis]|uniref:Pyridoxine 5'-phosphate synthase n=1 Tax=Reinekea blandensis MED297 TaxID=314283 RepID=A4BJ83_9GAMM|nr:pyridoxine 5'-phosphate synthase [Reinekea blandensis]EAR07836.1 Pyridoxal phosphate biosynthesis protein [Reinekea sp. MED297] [Reinekea blandensis MED297]